MRKRLLVISALVVLITLGFNLGGFFSGNSNSTKNYGEKQENTKQQAAQITYGIPTTLVIEKLGVTALVESVALDKEGRMDVPKNSDNVAWYNLGARPGDLGSAVIAGHLDKVSGAPAVFYNLSNLEAGDKIEITDKDNKKLTFVVERKETYDYNNFPLKEIFADTSGKWLNLITCNGTWDKDNKNYSERLVVYSRLEE